MKSVLLVVAAVAAMAVAGVQAGALFGEFEGRDQPYPSTPHFSAMNTWLGKRQSVVHHYLSFCPDASNLNWFFGQVLPGIWASGAVPALTWTPNMCKVPGDSPQQKVVWGQIVAGAYDAYVSDFAARAKKWLAGPDGVWNTADDRRIYIALGHEMNGSWESWSGNPDAYKSVWRRVRNLFAAAGATDRSHVQWVFNANNADTAGAYAAESYYPGGDIIDWLAIDGYNWGTTQSWGSVWQSPAAVFDPMLTRLMRMAPGKPVAIFEVGSTPIGDREKWITDLYAYIQARNIQMVLYFNTDKTGPSEQAWSVFGGLNGNSAAYQRALSTNPYYLSSDPVNPRLISDALFTGAAAAGVVPAVAPTVPAPAPFIPSPVAPVVPVVPVAPAVPVAPTRPRIHLNIMSTPPPPPPASVPEGPNRKETFIYPHHTIPTVQGGRHRNVKIDPTQVGRKWTGGSGPVAGGGVSKNATPKRFKRARGGKKRR